MWHVDLDVLDSLALGAGILGTGGGGNPYVARAIAPSHAMSRRFYYLHYRKVHDVPVAARTHVEVIRAVVMGDEKAAAEASDRMMDYVEKITRATVLSKL